MTLNIKLNSIQTKLTITNFIVLLLLTSFIFFITMQSNINRLKSDLVKEIETYMSFISQDLVRIVVFDSVDTASDLTLRLRSSDKINNLIVYNKEKKSIFYYTKKDYQHLNKTLPTWDKQSYFEEQSYLSLMPLNYYGQDFGYVYINISTKNINQALSNYKREGIAYIFALLVASLLLTLLFKYFVSDPILKLISALKYIGKTGDFTSLINVKRQDEIGALFSGFNEMQKAIQVANEELSDQKYALDEHSIVAVTNVKGDITFANKKFMEITGYDYDEIIGKNHRIIKSDFHTSEFFREMFKKISKGKVWHGEICNKAKDGHLYWVDTTIVPLMLPNGKPKSYISIRTDISELKAVQKKAEYLSQHDVLTGLPNRSQVEFHLNRAIERSKRNDTTLALIFMDLNKFKVINDNLGHDVGDKVLINVSNKFKLSLRKVDFVARHGGDEFVAIIEDITDEINLSHLLSKIIVSIEEPMLINNKQLYVGTSMGVSLYPVDAKNVAELFSHADVAMYKAKEHAHSNYQFYTKDLNQKVLSRYKLESDLRNALKKKELFCVFQPKIDMTSNDIIGAEVLIRWKQNDGGFILPSEFVPVAEACGLINNIWNVVLESSVVFANKLHKFNKKIPLALNISPVQFNYGSLDDEIISALNQYSLHTNALEIEITEGLLVDGNSKAKDILKSLSQKGIGIAIDDFGTGYSSMKYLKEFPIDTVKLDVSFVSGIGFNKDDEQLIKTMIDMSLSLGKKVIAEGLETDNQREFLLKHGCDLAQGYLYSKPLTESEFMAFIDTSAKVVSIFSDNKKEHL